MLHCIFTAAPALCSQPWIKSKGKDHYCNSFQQMISCLIYKAALASLFICCLYTLPAQLVRVLFQNYYSSYNATGDMHGGAKRCLLFLSLTWGCDATARIWYSWCWCVYTPLHNALQGEVAKAVCQAFLPELYILLTGRTGKQHGGMGLLPPSPWVCPTHWESDAGMGIKRKETQTEKNKKQGF